MDPADVPPTGRLPDFPTLDELLQRVLELRPLGAVATRVIRNRVGR